MVKDTFFAGKYEFPEIGSNSEELPDAVIPFNKALSSSEYNRWVHFYVHDVEFERIWNNPKQYLQMFKKYKGGYYTGFQFVSGHAIGDADLEYLS